MTAGSGSDPRGDGPETEDRLVLALIETVLTDPVHGAEADVLGFEHSEEYGAPAKWRSHLREVAGIPVSVSVHLCGGPALLEAGRQGAWTVRFRLPGYYFRIWRAHMPIHGSWPLHRVPDIVRTRLDDPGGTLRRDLAILALCLPGPRAEGA